MIPQTLIEPERQTPIVHEADLCVVGGSCTGVFAAVRAARLGLRVALIEQNTIFGGMATAAQVNEWHSTRDVWHEKQIIGGLSIELIDRLRQRGAVQELAPPSRGQFVFNSAEMAGELDVLVTENGIRPFLSARCVGAAREGNRISHAIIEDKSGRRAIRAAFWVDASGDGNLLRHAGFAAYQNEALQPANLQATVLGFEGVTGAEVNGAIAKWREEFNYPPANAMPWLFGVPGAPELRNIFGPRLNGVDASDADQLTATLMEARRHHRSLCDMVKRETGRDFSIVGWAQALGVRETWHARCRHQLRVAELLDGERFPDAIANGTYPTDVHSPTGTHLRYLDGREEVVALDGSRALKRWRAEELSPPFYQIPLRSLWPQDAENLLVAGRLIDAEREAFGGVRVMINCNQMGEAAGVAAALSLQSGEIVAAKLRETLVDGGSIVL